MTVYVIHFQCNYSKLCFSVYITQFTLNTTGKPNIKHKMAIPISQITFKFFGVFRFTMCGFPPCATCNCTEMLWVQPITTRRATQITAAALMLSTLTTSATHCERLTTFRWKLPHCKSPHQWVSVLVHHALMFLLTYNHSSKPVFNIQPQQTTTRITCARCHRDARKAHF